MSSPPWPRDLRVSRRRLLELSGLSALSTLLLGAAGASDLRIAQLQFDGLWNPRGEAIRRLLWEVMQRTSIEASLELAAVRAADPKLFRHPFLYWAGSGAVPEFSEEEIRRLRRYLTFGGTLLIDSADAEPGGAFDLSVRRSLARILPRQGLERISNDHVLYKSFYLVDHQGGRVLRVPDLEGIFLEKRIAVVYTQNDLGGAWARDAFGRWEYTISGGERQREMAFRLGINILMYALCLDYKEDLVHTPFILKRRR